MTAAALLWLESRLTSWVKLHTVAGDRVFAAFLSQQIAAEPAASPGAAAPVASVPMAGAPVAAAARAV